jgi:hypothetical protein
MRLSAGRQWAKNSGESAGFLTLWPTKKRTDSPPKACRYRAATAPLSLRRLEPGCARRDDARERNQRADIRVSNSRRHGPPIANQAPHRHRQANSGTCRGREPPHARHTFEVLPPETRPHKIDLSGRKSWCESDDPAFAAKAADRQALHGRPPARMARSARRSSRARTFRLSSIVWRVITMRTPALVAEAARQRCGSGTVPACFRWTIGALFGRPKREKPC